LRVIQIPLRLLHFITANKPSMQIISESKIIFDQNLKILIGCLVLAILFPLNAQAALVEAKGTAILVDNDITKARHLALQDALRQAMVQAGVHVTTASNVALNVLSSDSVRIRASGVVKDVVVLDEWMDKDDDHYHILIRARVEEKNFDDANANRYRKKIAIMQFSVTDRHHIHDMPNAEIRVAQELMRRLESSGDLLTVDASQYLLSESTHAALGLGGTRRQVIIDLARLLGVQVIMSGTILDMETTDHAFGVELRHVELELEIYDGLSGGLIAKFRDNGSTWTGRLFDFPVSGPAMNDKYFASPVGQKINKILTRFVYAVQSTLLRLPFTARVVRSKGRTVYFDVGRLSNLQVGDVFMAYRISEEPLTAPYAESHLGYLETPATSVVVKQVQPLFAIGELEVDTVQLKMGDVVRFAW